MTTSTVSNAAQLVAQLRLAKAGDTILLKAGNYGDVSIANIKAAGPVTIASADATKAAVFNSLKLTNDANLGFSSIVVAHVLAKGEALTAPAVSVVKSSGINLVGLDVHGSLNGSSFDDGNGIVVTDSTQVRILDSAFRQLNVAVSLGRDSGVVVAGNSFTEAREGVHIAQVAAGLFEKNYLTNFQPNYAAGDHPDYFQVLTGTGFTGSSGLTFRDNVMIQGGSGFVGGIFIKIERLAEGIVHSDINVANNYYQNTYRHGISLDGVVGATITGNTVMNSTKAGDTAAIFLRNDNGIAVNHNITALVLQDLVAPNKAVTVADNVMLYDAKLNKTGIDPALLFSPLPAGDIDFAKLAPFPGSTAATLSAGFHGAGGIGNLAGGFDAIVSSYNLATAALPAFQHLA